MGDLVSLSWPSHAKHLTEGIWNLFNENFQTDFELYAESKDCSGGGHHGRKLHVVHVHHIMLSVFCPSLRNVKEKNLILGKHLDIHLEDLTSLVEFIYRGRIDVAEERLSNLRRGAEVLGLKVLVDLIENFTGSRSREELDVMQSECKNKKTTTSKRKGKPVKITRHPDEEEEDEAANDNEEEDDEDDSDELKSGENYQEEDKQNELAASSEYDSDNDDESPEEEDDQEEYCPSPKRTRHSKTVVKSGGGGSSHEDDESSSSRKMRLKTEELLESLDLKNLLCKICNKAFKNQYRLFQHVRCHKNPESLWRCQHCDYKAEFKVNFIQHLASKHEVDIEGNPLRKSIKCPECDFTCVAKPQLRNHKLVKHSDKPFVCDTCGYSCYSKSSLVKHKEGVHGHEMPFICETCGFRTKTLGRFKMHLTIHKDKVKCSICGVSVTYQSMSRHMAIHNSDRKPFLCHLCSFASRTKYNLKVHLKNVHKIPIEAVLDIVNQSKYKPASRSVNSDGTTEVVNQHLNISELESMNILL